MIFAMIHSFNNDYAASYEGQDEETILRLQSERGNTVTFISEKEFLIFRDSHMPKSDVFDPLKQQAILDAKNVTKTPEERLDALVKVIGL